MLQALVHLQAPQCQMECQLQLKCLGKGSRKIRMRHRRHLVGKRSLDPQVASAGLQAAGGVRQAAGVVHEVVADAVDPLAGDAQGVAVIVVVPQVFVVGGAVLNEDLPQSSATKGGAQVQRGQTTKLSLRLRQQVMQTHRLKHHKILLQTS
jgi:hypothetical protein